MENPENLKAQMSQEEQMDFSKDLRRVYQEYVEETRTDPKKSEKKFPYAAVLIRSPDKNHIRNGVKLLEELAEDDPQDKRVYIYHLAIAHYRLQEYITARRYTEILLKLEPNNRQAQKFKAILDEQVTKDGLVGMGIVGGVGIVAAAAAVGGIFLIKALAK